MEREVWITKGNVRKLVNTASLIAGGFAGWTLLEGQHIVVKVLGALVAAGICCQTSDWILS